MPTEPRLEAPVVFIVYNRRDTAERVFQSIRQARPRRLFVIAGGPRADRPDDAANCVAVRALFETVDWDCELLPRYAPENLGCKKTISAGLHWVFEQTDRAIILEHDCLPHPTFYRYCDELLDRYRDDERVMMLSGDNYMFGRRVTPYSYYFTRVPHIWGWATWRRAWRHYDGALKGWPEIRDAGLFRGFRVDEGYRRAMLNSFEELSRYDRDIWDVQWAFTCWAQGGLSVAPAHNLVSNIGFGPGAGYTTRINRFAHMATAPLEFPLTHPPHVLPNWRADALDARLNAALWRKLWDFARYFFVNMKARRAARG